MQLVLEKPDVYKLSHVNQDNLWKKLIADLFEDFLLFFLPELHLEVDFSKQVEFLQQELFKEIIEHRQGRKIADQIAKVHLKNGKEQWILVHTEIQAGDEVHFAKHMFEYFYRIRDRYGKKIVAIAIFTDKSTKSTNRYYEKYYGTEITYTFNKFVVSDFDEEELEKSPKLFSKALLASIYMNRTKNKFSLRSAYKRALLREVWLLNNIERTEIRALLYFIDYLMKLPKPMSEQLVKDVKAEIREEEEILRLYKEDLPPTLVGVLELERQEGFEQGIEQGIKQIIIGLIEKGAEDEWIAEVAKLPVTRIKEIRVELK
ncbi:hypothetical protein [Lysinibacillus sp. fls2-241-R2A-57]|uniref:hypothetical protein n=1 Tax=Lysinibacillus sp. fls2-241-R2A-57 TaxID=3040292 RepID=UPI002555412B|nr:hypothetical protein [Lysinibacillus sp. fls2-241-R2A-57]